MPIGLTRTNLVPIQKKKKRVETIDFLCEHSLSMIMLGSKDLGLNV